MLRPWKAVPAVARRARAILQAPFIRIGDLGFNNQEGGSAGKWGLCWQQQACKQWGFDLMWCDWMSLSSLQSTTIPRLGFVVRVCCKVTTHFYISGHLRTTCSQWLHITILASDYAVAVCFWIILSNIFRLQLQLLYNQCQCWKLAYTHMPVKMSDFLIRSVFKWFVLMCVPSSCQEPSQLKYIQDFRGNICNGILWNVLVVTDEPHWTRHHLSATHVDCVLTQVLLFK